MAHINSIIFDSNKRSEIFVSKIGLDIEMRIDGEARQVYLYNKGNKDVYVSINYTDTSFVDGYIYPKENFILDLEPINEKGMMQTISDCTISDSSKRSFCFDYCNKYCYNENGNYNHILASIDMIILFDRSKHIDEKGNFIGNHEKLEDEKILLNS